MAWNKPYRPARNQRLNPELYVSSDRIYFITIRACLNRSPFVRDEFNQLMLGLLREEQERQRCTVFTYCLMPDHLHFLVSPRQDGTSVLKFTDQYKGRSTNRSWTLGWEGRLWQPRYYDHIIRADENLRHIAEYILNNPIRRSLAVNVEDWLWGGHMNPLPL